jgi:hypothetical protein
MTQLIINNITTGTLVPPFSGYVCTVYNVGCVYVGQITTTPVTITLPPAFNMAPAIGFKLIDSTGCEKFGVLPCIDIPPEEKQFQDGDDFYFMSWDIYQFQ